MTGKLELKMESGGPRHYLDGRAVHCGTQLEILLGHAPGAWISARYEADLNPHGIKWNLIAVGGRIAPDSDATLRWPGKDGAA